VKKLTQLTQIQKGAHIGDQEKSKEIEEGTASNTESYRTSPSLAKNWKLVEDGSEETFHY